MERVEFIDKISKLIKELEKSDGFQAMLVVNNINKLIDNLIKLETPMIIPHVPKSERSRVN